MTDRRRARRGTSPLVWIVIVVFAIGLSALGMVCAARGSDTAAPPAKTASGAQPTKPPPDAAPKRVADCDAIREPTRVISEHAMRMEKLPADVADNYRRTILPKIIDGSVAVCRDDAWSPEVIRCMAGAETDIAHQRCLAKLPKEQVDRVRAVVNRAAYEVPSSIASTRPDPACAAAAAAFVKVALADVTKRGTSGQIAAIPMVTPHLTTALTRVCSDDRWEPRVVKCMETLSSGNFKSCAQQLPADHQRNLDTAIATAMGMGKMIPR